MIPRTIFKPIYQFHKKVKMLVISVAVLSISTLALLGYVVYSNVSGATVSQPLAATAPAALEPVSIEPETGYDLDSIRDMYKALAKDKKFIGDGLYVVLWDKSTHTFYDSLTQNVDTPYNAASVTKLMTALTLAEDGVLSSKLIDSGSTEDPTGLPEGEAAGDFRGQTFPQSDLVAAMLIQSSNQAAYSLVKPIGKDDFLVKMNKAARKLGMSRTILRDPSGYDFGSKSQASYMSPRDVARVAFELVSQYPDLVKLSSNSQFDITNTRGKKFTLHNTNPLVEKTDNVLLSKTGYTNLAGGNLAMVTEPRPGVLAAFVSLHSTKDGRFSDIQSMVGMMNTAFDMYDVVKGN